MIYGYLTSLISTMQTAGFTVAAPTNVNRLWDGSTTDRTQKEAVAEAYNTLVRDNAGSFGITVLDYDADTNSQTPTNSTYFFTDQLHWRAPLYESLAPIVANWINGII